MKAAGWTLTAKGRRELARRRQPNQKLREALLAMAAECGKAAAECRAAAAGLESLIIRKPQKTR